METLLPLAPMLRYFCHTAETGAVSDLGVAYLDAFLALGLRVRLMSGSGPVDMITENGRWTRRRALFMTPMTAPFVNVVCIGPSSIDVKIPPMQLGGEVVVDRSPAIGRLYTVGLRNVLITDEPPGEPRYVAAALRYEAMIVPSAARGVEWELVGARPLVVPIASIDVMVSLRGLVLAP
jgi:hypothetical protein